MAYESNFAAILVTSISASGVFLAVAGLFVNFVVLYARHKTFLRIGLFLLVNCIRKLILGDLVKFTIMFAGVKYLQTGNSQILYNLPCDCDVLWFYCNMQNGVLFSFKF